MLLTDCKKYIAIFFLVLICAPVFAKDDIPEPIGWVNDFAGVISPEYADKINSLVSGLEQKTSAEVTVVTISSIANYDEKEYARLLFDKWKPGKKGKDNGVLILLILKERRWRIEVGYGSEGVLTDAFCSQIGRNYMAPYFKQSNYQEGLYNGAAAIVKVLGGEELPLVEYQAKSSENIYNVIFFIIFLILWVSLRMFFPIFLGGRHGGYYGSGYGGGGFGGGGFGGFGGGGGGGGGGGW